VQLILTWVTDLLGGGIIPLILFPLALQKVIFLLPFAAMFSTPLLIYVGQIPPAGYPTAFGSQVGWLLVLAGIATVIWRAGARRVVVQGG
jgi:ABC-2 type transport system permease protein